MDDGSRVAWGLKSRLMAPALGPTDLFLGQSYAFTSSQDTLKNQGLNRSLSDYVARFRTVLTSWFSFESRALLDRHKLSASRLETLGTFGQPLLNLTVQYTRLPRSAFSTLKSEQIGLQLKSQMTKEWSTYIHSTRELGARHQSLSHGLGVTYADECFKFDTTVTRTFFQDRDYRPGLTFMFRLSFKNLGDVAFSGQQLGLDKSPQRKTPLTDKDLPALVP
jgi:LPS-assembly protein